jgi:hypothetical protein
MSKGVLVEHKQCGCHEGQHRHDEVVYEQQPQQRPFINTLGLFWLLFFGYIALLLLVENEVIK